MSAPINYGGPAFPNPEIETEVRDEHGVLKAVEVSFATRGMTMRQYYAAAALTGILSNPQSGSGMGQMSGKELADAVAEASFAYADEMIKHQEDLSE